MLELILASGSEARKQTLERMGFSFTCVPSNVNERCNKKDPSDYVLEIAKRKLSAVCKRVANPDAIVLSADTTVYFEGCFIGKPCGKSDANKTLSMLMGRTHEVYTGVVLSLGALYAEHVGIADVTMRDFNPHLIEGYLATGDWKGRAGSYAAFGKAAPLIKSIEEDPGTVSGLPVHSLCALFQKFGINPYDLMKK